MKTKFAATVGMATYDDFDGVYFTVTALQLYHKKWIDEIIVVNNNPDSREGKRIEVFCHNLGVRHIPLRGVQGTSLPRQMVFDNAKDKNFVLCMDSHVLLHPGSFESIEEYCRLNPGNQDLIQGVLVYDGARTYSCQFNSRWGAGMKGQWEDNPLRKTEAWFEIPAQGLGLFGCFKQDWLGFNPRFRYFGGEEWYIHDKYRNAGRKTVCLSGLQWSHRFHDQTVPTKYPNRIDYRLANYLIGWDENKKPRDEVINHFQQQYPDLFTNEKVSQILEYVEGRVENIPDMSPINATPCGSCSERAATTKSIEDLYNTQCKTVSDINEHLPTLKELAKDHVVVEFGVRTGVSTTALLAGRPRKLISYDLNDSAQARNLLKVAAQERIPFEFWMGDSRVVDIEECDVLFIDTLHNGEHVYQELMKNGKKVRKYIAFHDTEIFGLRGEGGKVGLLTGIRMFLKQNPEWHTIRHDKNNNGFTIISRLKEDAPKPLPSILTMTYNYAKSEAKDLINGRIRVPLEVAEARYEICTSNHGKCPMGQRNIDTDRCAGCGCWLQEQIDKEGKSLGKQTGKVWRPLDYCPHGLWGEYAKIVNDQPANPVDTSSPTR